MRMLDINHHNYESIDEPEQAQVHSIYYQLNQVQKVRDSLLSKGTKYCEDCGDQIPQARRAAYPAARTCIHCQTDREMNK